jgi:hypothetical protein
MDSELPLDMAKGLQDHKSEGMREALLHYGEYHPISVILILLKILVELLNYIETLDH